MVGAPLFAQPKPPKFLRPHEVKQLFNSLKLSSAKDLRNYAMVHLGSYLRGFLTYLYQQCGILHKDLASLVVEPLCLLSQSLLSS